MLAALALSLSVVTGCGNESDLESADYGNLLASPAGLVVVEQEHPDGWGRPDCFTCHAMNNMHVQNRTGVEDFDMEEIRALILAEGEASCEQCHGNNGVEP